MIELFDAVTNRLASIGGTLTFFGILWTFIPRYWRRYRSWRASRTLAGIDNEIALIKRLHASPSARIEYMLMRSMIVFMMAGFWLFLRTQLEIIQGTLHLTPMIDLIVGGVIYMFSAISIGQLNALKDAKMRLEKLQEQRSQLVEKMENRLVDGPVKTR